MRPMWTPRPDADSYLPAIKGGGQVRLRTVEAASLRYGWPSHVIEDCRDDPTVEPPETFLDALRTVIGTSRNEEST